MRSFYLLIVSCLVVDVQDIFKFVGCTHVCTELMIIEFTGDLIWHPATINVSSILLKVGVNEIGRSVHLRPHPTD